GRVGAGRRRPPPAPPRGRGRQPRTGTAAPRRPPIVVLPLLLHPAAHLPPRRSRPHRALRLRRPQPDGTVRAAQRFRPGDPEPLRRAWPGLLVAGAARPPGGRRRPLPGSAGPGPSAGGRGART